MTDTQKHRGPDDDGAEVLSEDPILAFGHRRLSIIDVSSAGHQPMHDPVTGVSIVFNGEIYNFRELRASLTSLGHEFRTGTDTEVILRAYVQWGRASPERLRGIFAWGLWDPRNRSLLLARDRFGIKPLYYHTSEGELQFASEVRAVLASGLVDRSIDLGALDSFLAFGSVQEPATLVAGIRSLPPGYTLEMRDGLMDLRQYWRFPTPSPTANGKRVSDEEIRAALENAVASQLVADVPLGAFLSGGIDSTAITALMQRTSDTPVNTFSLVFDETEYDERMYSRLAAARIGTRHTEVLLTGPAVAQSVSQALDAFDQPSMDGLNSYFVSRAAREAGLTVALSGLGGDEVFAGYNGFAKQLRIERMWRRMAPIPRCIRRPAAYALSKLSRTEWQRRGVELLAGDRSPYFMTRLVFTRSQTAELLKPGFVGESPEIAARESVLDAETRALDPVNRIAALELQTYMLSTLLRDTDQMSMANSLEVRVPLIDHHLVELLSRIPGSEKIDPVIPKVLLTRPLGEAIPRGCVYRPKRGFELPFAKWLRTTLEAEVRDSFLGSDQSSPFRPDALGTLWQDFASERLGWSRIWGVFVLRRWLQKHALNA